MVIKRMLPGPVTVDNAKQFAKEVHFYSDIIPALEEFEKISNIPETERFDAFGRYFCSRFLLNPGKSFVAPIFDRQCKFCNIMK